MDHNIIYSYGGGSVLYYVFNGIAAILGGTSVDSTFMQILKLASTIGGFWIIVTIATRNSVTAGISWFMWFLLATEMLFIPKVPILIKDPVTRFERKVDNIPFGLAFISGFFSQFGQIMTEKMEQNFSLPDDFKYHKTGSVFASRLISSMDKARITSADFAETMHSFVNQCVVIPAMIGKKYTIDELRDSNDVWNLIKTNAPKNMRFTYKEPYSHDAPKLMRCKEGAAELDKHIKNEVSKVSVRLAKTNLPDFIASIVARQGESSRNAGITQAKQLLEGYISSTYAELRNTSTAAEEVLKQQMMINAIIDGSSNKAARMGANSNYATAKAMLQQKNTYSIMGFLAQGLPMVKTVFEALCYGSFVFIILLSLMPAGYKILFNYFQIIMWLQLWAPLNAILNLIITLTAKSRTTDMLAGTGVTWANSAGIIQINEDMHSYAMYLSMLVPFIAIAIVKGGVSSFVHLASHIGSGYQAAAASTAGEVTSGNISLGNISQRQMHIDNTQMYQNTTSPNFNTGQHTEVMQDGSIKKLTADGSLVYQSGTGTTVSTFPTTMSMKNAMSNQLNEGIATEQSAIASRNKEISDAESVTERQTADFIERATIAQNSGRSYDFGESTTSAKSIQNILDFSKNLQERFGFSEKQASAITAGISGSLGADNSKFKAIISWAISGNAGMNYSTDAQRDQAVSDVIDYYKKSGYSESLDSISKASKDAKFGESETEDQALQEGLSASYDKIQSLRTQNSISEQNIDRHNKILSFVQSSGFNLDKVVNQDFLNWLSTREDIRGNVYGTETARKMISRWDSNAQMYWGKYVGNQLSDLSTQISKGQTNISSTYERTNIGGLDKQGVFDSVRSTASAKGVTATVLQNQDLKEKVEGKLDQSSREIEKQGNQHTKNYETQQSKTDQNYGENLVTSALSNIMNTNKHEK